MLGVLPNPDSVILSQIHVIVMAPHTKRKLVTITCFTLKESISLSKRRLKQSNTLLDHSLFTETVTTERYSGVVMTEDE